MKKYSIYIIRNTVNNKVYIGQTCQDVHERFMQHLKPSTHKIRGTYKIYNAMNKYGSDKFYCETLESMIEESEIDQKEIEYIAKYDSFNNGYNSTPGGDGRTISKIEDIEKFKLLYSQKTNVEVAKILNVNVVTVVRTAKALGLPDKSIKPISKEYFLKNSDKTNIEMAKELQVGEDTITRYLKKYGLERGKGFSNVKNKQNQQKLTKQQEEEFIKMWYDRQILVDTIAKHFNLCQGSILSYANRLGLPKRRTIPKER